MSRPSRVISLLLASLCAGWLSHAQAGLFDDDEARKQIKETSERISGRIDKLESGQSTLSNGQLDLSNQLELQRDEISRLRGQLEVLTYELEAAQKRQKDFYIDLDNRLRKLEPSGAPGEAPPAAPAADPAQESKEFDNALGLLKGGKYKDAALTFTSFIKNWPKSSYLPAAYFWTGMSWMQAKDLNKSVELFNKVATAWPDDPRAPDALSFMATAQDSLGDAKGAKKTRETLVAKYPKSDAAKVAAQKLGKK